jgi:hypothetical protein
MQRIRPFILPFNKFIRGLKNNLEWDTPKMISEAMLDVGAFLLKHMRNLLLLGAPISVTHAITLYDKFMRKALPAELQLSVVVLTHDTAEPCVGCLHGEEQGVALQYKGLQYPDFTSVVTFEDDLEVQVRQEGL